MRTKELRETLLAALVGVMPEWMHNLDYAQLIHPEVGLRANGVATDQAVLVVTVTASH